MKRIFLTVGSQVDYLKEHYAGQQGLETCIWDKECGGKGYFACTPAGFHNPYVKKTGLEVRLSRVGIQNTHLYFV